METAESALGERRLRKRPELTGGRGRRGITSLAWPGRRERIDEHQIVRAQFMDTPAYQQSDVLGYIMSAELAIRQLEQAAVDA